ncbi:Alpha/Beta hydrolase protein [Scenedesmus sp. NREL 46B-D3]|nr:Alpha/Beta hydrolase protein [Scenedesmus sp. NREL 46B-D3]
MAALHQQFKCQLRPIRCAAQARPMAHSRRPVARTLAQAQSTTSFMPQQLAEVTEPAAQAMAARMQRTPVPIPSLPIPPLATAFVGPSETQKQQLRAISQDRPPVVLLHGFDSSSLEFRRLYPLLEPHTETYAVDLVGWGFTDCEPFAANPDLTISPQQKREHLFSFWREHIQRPMVLVGSSLGGAIALDFALEYPQAVEKLVLIDAQGFIEGIGPMASLPRPVAAAGVWVLRSEQLRMAANRMAYHDQAFATLDAMRVGRLHTNLPGWADANIAFMRSGGYRISTRIRQVQQPALVLWGRQDQILEPKYAAMFEEALPNATLQWVEECGHCAHLEQPTITAASILAFIDGTDAPQQQRAAAGAAVESGVAAGAQMQ